MVLKLVSAALLAISVDAFAPIASPPSASSLLATTNNDDITSINSRRAALYTIAGLIVSPLLVPALPASARLEGVNKPGKSHSIISEEVLSASE